jgi:hypothetical protein
MVPKDYLILIVPLMLLLAQLGERRPWLKRWGVPGIVILLLVGLWYLTIALVSANAYATLINILILFLPVILVLGLYWMRWWYIRTVPTGMETPP